MNTPTPSPNRRQILKWGTAAGLTGPLIGSRALAEEKALMTIPVVQKYKRLGRTDFNVSDISFGSSGLRNGQEDLVRYAIDRGINYLDTAESYTNGNSEKVIGNVTKDKRDKVYIVSKVVSRANWSSDEFMSHLEGSLKRLQTDYVDVYMNHAVNEIERVKSPEWHEFVDKAKEQGKVRFTGMSGHGGRLAECLDYALEQEFCDVILCAYNFGQDPGFMSNLTRGGGFVARQPELPRLLKKAKDNDVGTVAMKTLAGARLNDMKPFETEEGTFAQAAFRWVLSNSDMDALIISMRTDVQVSEFLGASGAEQSSSYDIDLLNQYLALNNSTYCRPGCNDCEGSCTYGVQIGDVLRTRMYATDYKDIGLARDGYANIATNASACITCTGKPCADACTYGVSIAALSAPTHRMLA